MCHLNYIIYDNSKLNIFHSTYGSCIVRVLRFWWIGFGWMYSCWVVRQRSRWIWAVSTTRRSTDCTCTRSTALKTSAETAGPSSTQTQRTANGLCYRDTGIMRKKLGNYAHRFYALSFRWLHAPLCCSVMFFSYPGTQGVDCFSCLDISRSFLCRYLPILVSLRNR